MLNEYEYYYKNIWVIKMTDFIAEYYRILIVFSSKGLLATAGQIQKWEAPTQWCSLDTANQ
jgi:hypothetical protein